MSRQLENAGELERKFHPNGAAAAAILAAGTGSLALAILTVAADRFVPLKNGLSFYKPTGPLSGATTVAIAIWLFLWIVLDRLWHRRDVSLQKVNALSIALLLLSLLATFPPLADLL